MPFIAVMPRSTSAEKVAQIASYGGESHFVESAAAMYAESARLARELGGHYMDQFTYAERATDWRGNNNIAETIFAQMADEEHPVPLGSSSGPEREAPQQRWGGISVIVAFRPDCASPIPKPLCFTVI